MIKLQENDIIKFKNGSKKIYSENDDFIISEFYDENLRCINNDNYTIVEILRPHYERIYGNGIRLEEGRSK